MNARPSSSALRAAPVARARNRPAPQRSQRQRSDSNQHWREGCPHDELRSGAFEWLQLLVHPAIWVYTGETMGETMRAMLDAKREELLGYLAADRIDLA